MSSESDVEEFFDAQDVTPVTGRTVAARASDARLPVKNEEIVEQRSNEVGSMPLDDLEQERRRLLEKQKLAEERRRKEEEEIHRQLAEIERRKVEEAERKRVDERRKKLEELRLSVDSNLTPQRLQSTQLSTNSEHRLSTPDVDRIGQASPSSLHRRCSEAEDVPQISSSLSERRSSGTFFPTVDKSRLPDNFMNTNDTINRNRPMNIEVDKVPSKIIPEVVIDFRSGQSVGVSSLATRDDDSAAVADDEEISFQPDIVQSTKTRSLNRLGQLAPPIPVAPPRKKKVSSVGHVSDSLPNIVRPHSMGDEAFSKVINLTQEPESSVGMPGTEDGSEPTLDINSATKGNRVVTVIEDCSARGDRGKEEDSDPDLLKPSSSKEQKEDEPTAVEHRMMKLTLGITGTGKGGEDYSFPINVSRPRSGSGSRYLTDTEILEQVFVLNLDTGETVPLSSAEEKLPRCINPLSLHIMRRTKEYSSDPNLFKADQSDDEGLKDSNGPRMVKTVKPLRKRKLKLKKFFRTKLKGKMKSGGAHGEDSASDDEELGDGRAMIKVKAAHSNKGPYEFDMLVPIQDLAGQCSGAVWTMKFSHCGRLLATGGQDNLLRVWVLKDAFNYFNDMRQKYNEASTKVSPAPSQDSLNSQNEGQESTKPEEEEEAEGLVDDEDAEYLPFMKQPFCIYRGHTADLLDVSWSKNYFILSSSMDKTVRLWHISRRECLCCFQHIDFVTAIAFHPKDDRYFLSGSLDGKLRLWNIPDKKVALWNEVSSGTKLITAANFCLNGRFAVVGTYDGRCVFYSTEQLKYYTQIHVRSTRGKNARGRKITGVEPFPGEDKILVTSNDSRIRLYDLRDLTLTCKYKGCANNSSQIKASFSHDGKFIICGSEDHYVYVWKTQHDFYKFHSARRDRNDFWEGIKAHSAVVTNAIFAPNPLLIIKPQFQYVDMDDKENTEAGQGEVLVSADYSGLIKIFINKFKPGN